MSLPKFLASVLLALWPAMAMGACEDSRSVHRLDGGPLRIQASPDREYVGWLHELGTDVALVEDGLEIDSAPGRRGSEPFRRRSDAQGRLTLALRTLRGPPDGRVLVELVCRGGSEADLEHSWNSVLRAAYWRARHAVDREPATGLRAYAALLHVLASSGADGEHRLWALQQLVSLALRHGLSREAASWAALAAAEAAEQGKRMQQGLAELARGQALLALQVSEADQALILAQALLADSDSEFHRVVAGQDRCLLQRMRGELDAAVDCLADSAEAFARIGERQEQLNTLRNRATALLNSGRFDEARQQLAEAVALAGSAGSPRQRTMLRLLQAQTATWAAEFEPALAHLSEALDSFEAEGDAIWTAHLQRLIADTYSLAGEPARALGFYRRALERLRSSGLQRRSASVLLGMAGSLAALGRFDEAVDAAQQATELFASSARWHEEQDARLRLAELLWENGDADAAGRVLPAAAAGLSDPQQLRRLLLVARLQPGQEEHDAQLAQAARDNLQQGRILTYLRIGRLQVERLASQPAEARRQAAAVSARVLPVARRIRSPGLRGALLRELHWLAAGPRMSWPEGPVEAEEARRTVAQFELLAQAQASDALLDSEAMFSLERALGLELLGDAAGAQDSQREQAYLRLVAEDARMGSVAEAAGTTWEMPQLEPGHRLVYPLFTRDRGGLLLVDGDAWRWLPVDAPRLRTLRQGVLASLGEGHAEAADLAEQVRLLRELLGGARLFSPGFTRMSIVVHAELAGLPIEWIAEAEGQAPQVAWLNTLQAHRLASPRSLHLFAAALSADERLPGLHAAAAELDAVAAAWNPRLPAQPRRSGAAPFLAALESPGALVHLAAHGQAGRLFEEASGLWLQDQAGAPQFLSALRLRRSTVRAGLVVLGACESGHGAHAGLGFGGVAAGLIEAGAGAVIATRWPVGDRTAQRFAATLHRHLAASPEDPAAAVDAARRELRRQPSTRHPSHWAGWFLLQRGHPSAS